MTKTWAIALALVVLMSASAMHGQTKSKTNENTLKQSRYFKKHHRHYLALEELGSVLDLFLKDTSGTRKSDRLYLLEKRKEIADTIADMPSAYLTVDEFYMVSAWYAEREGLELEKTYLELEAKLEKHWESKSSNVISTRKQQWDYVEAFFEKLARETSCHDQVLAAFCWRIFGVKGLPLLLKQKMIFEKTGIEESHWLAIDKAAKRREKEYLSKIPPFCRQAIQKILNELTEKQQNMLASRLGIAIEKIPELYDDCFIKDLDHILSSKPQHCVRFCSIHVQNDGWPISFRKRLEEWENPETFSRNRRELVRLAIRHHVTEFKEPNLKVSDDLKNMFSNVSSFPMLLDTREFTVDDRIRRRLNADTNMRKWFLANYPTEHNAWRKDDYRRTNVELTHDQYRKLLLLSNDATDKLDKVESIEEVVDIHNEWIAELDEFLLPQQSARIYQSTVARQGLVFFLTREDVAREMRITEAQRRKILAVAKKLRQEAKEFDAALRADLITQILDTLPADSRHRLLKLLGTDSKEFTKIVSTKLVFYNAFKVLALQKYDYPARKVKGRRKSLSNPPANIAKKRVEEILGITEKK